jgi:hypothetical protein
MNLKKERCRMSGIKLSGVGCSLMDFLYANIDFESDVFKKYLSGKPGDGGLTPGHLVFLDDLEIFSGSKAQNILDELTGGKAPDTHNIGGPAIVADASEAGAHNAARCPHHLRKTGGA